MEMTKQFPNEMERHCSTADGHSGMNPKLCTQDASTLWFAFYSTLCSAQQMETENEQLFPCLKTHKSLREGFHNLHWNLQHQSYPRRGWNAAHWNIHSLHPVITSQGTTGFTIVPSRAPNCTLIFRLENGLWNAWHSSGPVVSLETIENVYSNVQKRKLGKDSAEQTNRTWGPLCPKQCWLCLFSLLCML